MFYMLKIIGVNRCCKIGRQPTKMYNRSTNTICFTINYIIWVLRNSAHGKFRPVNSAVRD